MSGRGTAILAALAGLSALLYFAAPRDDRVALPTATLLGEPRYVDPSQPVEHLFAFDPAQVTAVSLIHGSVRATARRAGAQWEGVDNAARFEEFLGALAATAKLTTIEAAPTDLAVYGLATPSRRLVLDLVAGPPVTLAIGDRTPVGTAVYVRLGDGPVELAGSLLLWEIDKGKAAITGRLSP